MRFPDHSQPPFFRPKELETTEEPVYDLRDNPDFKYRPGSIVIRVSNFDEPGVSNCGGQVLDNYSSGQIKVWWGDGRTSFVWPQDLYKVGECYFNHKYNTTSVSGKILLDHNVQRVPLSSDWGV